MEESEYEEELFTINPAFSPNYLIEEPNPKPCEENFYGLLENETDRYFCNSYGPEKAITLEGSPEFIRRAGNLFVSFGGEHKKRLTKVHKYNEIITMIPLSEGTLLTALRRYLFGMLRKHDKINVIKTVLLDEEGDYQDTVYSGESEEETMERAENLAIKFYTERMPINSNFFYQTVNSGPNYEYGFGSISSSAEHNE